MSTITLTIAPEYGYVILTSTLTFFVGLWHGARVNSFRKAAQIPYPYDRASAEQISSATSAEKKDAMNKFNCAQRAHMNFLENYPIILPAMMISGFKYPVATAALGIVWNASRIAYAVGYTSGQPSKRLYGTPQYIPALAFLGLTVKFGWDLLSA